MSLATTTVPQHADGVYIWVGPGDAATFPSVKTDNYSRVLLIEADELQQEHLLQLQQTDAKISVLLQAVATEDGPAQLYRYNLSQFNALQPATGLVQLYPGLKLQEQSSVEAINFATLVREQQLAPQDCHTLVLSVPAQALALLQSLAEQQLLTLFSQLTVQTAAIELYQDAGTCQELESWLLLQGYLHAATDNTDPDLVVMTFRRHALLDKIETLVIANAQLTEQLTASKAEQQALRQQLEQQSQQFNVTAESQQAELAKLAQANVALTNNIEQIKTQHSAELQALEAKLQQAEQALTAERQAADKDTTQLQQQIQLLEDKLQSAGSGNAELLLTTQSLTAQKTQAEQANAELQQKLQQAELVATEAQRIAAADAEQAKQQIQALETTLKTTSSSNTELIAKAESLALLHAQAEQSMLELQQKLLQAEQLIIDERKSAAAANAQLEEQLQVSEQQLQAAKADSTGLVAQVESLQSQKAQADKTVTELQLQLQAAKENSTGLVAKVESLQSQKVQADKTVTELQQQLQVAKDNSAGLAAKVESLQSQKTQADKTATELQQQLQVAKDNSAGLATTVESLQSQKAQTDKTSTELQQQLDKHKSDLAAVAKHAATRLDKINQLEKTNKQLQDTNTQLNARQQLLENEMLKAEAQIDLIKELILKE